MDLALDSSILIAAEKGHFRLDAVVADAADAQVLIPSIVASEILFGCERAVAGKRRDVRLAFLEEILAAFPVIEFGLDEARTHARLGARLAAEGITIGAHDLIIAATCLHHDLDLATLNAGEFARVHGLRLLPVTPFLLDRP